MTDEREKEPDIDWVAVAHLLSQIKELEDESLSVLRACVEGEQIVRKVLAAGE